MFFDLVTSAYAMGPSQSAEGGPQQMMSTIAMFAIIFAVFYFFLIRPQQKKAKQMKQMLDSLKKGDKIVTIGGIYGVVESVEETTVGVKIAENVRVKISRTAISTVRTTDE
jgi:preprotein translocase subunit YajC